MGAVGVTLGGLGAAISIVRLPFSNRRSSFLRMFRETVPLHRNVAVKCPSLPFSKKCVAFHAGA